MFARFVCTALGGLACAAFAALFATHPMAVPPMQNIPPRFSTKNGDRK